VAEAMVLLDRLRRQESVRAPAVLNQEGVVRALLEEAAGDPRTAGEVLTDLVTVFGPWLRPGAFRRLVAGGDLHDEVGDLPFLVEASLAVWCGLRSDRPISLTGSGWAYTTPLCATEAVRVCTCLHAEYGHEIDNARLIVARRPVPWYLEGLETPDAARRFLGSCSDD